ncbi:MAG: UDP-3-O-(3-hydroxymyristoyl)glucosamine N-acyltransferase [Flavobacteriales bacterium]|nr:UDP-3-O-(3-hydroxymyristoyl)glucosamine N-acyltransferase [Flavobacteriales bacterium]
MEFSARQIADILGGTVEGSETTSVNRLSKIEEGELGTLTFLANLKYAPYIYNTGASVAIVNNDFVAEEALPATLTLIRVEDAYGAFAKLLDFYNSYRHQKSGQEPTSFKDDSADVADDVYLGHHVVVSANAKVGSGSKVYSGAYIGERAKIGEGCIIHPGVRILDDCVIGNNCTLHAGAVIGSDGFGFAPDAENNYQKVAQIGNVIIEDHVEIGANTTVDRATLGSTIIRKGVKLDNLIQIAHNVEIGENTVIAAQTGIAGSTRIGKNCMIGGQVGIVGHIRIADGVKIAAQSGLSASVLNEGEIIQGSPALGIRAFKMSYIGFKNLPKIDRRLSDLEKKVDGITDNNTSAE